MCFDAKCADCLDHRFVIVEAYETCVFVCACVRACMCVLGLNYGDIDEHTENDVNTIVCCK